MRVKVSPKLKCLKCGHSWRPRIKEVRVCPRCKNAYWDVPKKIKTGGQDEQEISILEEH